MRKFRSFLSLILVLPMILLGIANGEVDALTGTLLAAEKEGPLLLTNKDRLTDTTRDEMERLKAKTVYMEDLV